jgi:tetratricopeptide (TPR) repeat protein
MKLTLTVLGLGVAAFISGCSPVPSVRPLYTDADLEKPIAEPRIEGEWISPDVDKAGTDEELWLKWKIQAPPPPVGAQSSYTVEFRPAKPDPGHEEDEYVYDVRLVAIGDKLFFDAEFRRYALGKEEVRSTDVLGLVPGHLVGRVWVQQDFLRIALLKPDWVEQNWPTGFYRYGSSNYSDDDIVITGSTQELRDFLVKNADNPKALGYAVYLCRPGADCATRAAEDALVRTPDDEDVLDAASKFYIARGNYALAAKVRQHRAELEPDKFSRHMDSSNAYLLARDFAAARRESEATQKLVLEDPAKTPSSLPNNLQAAYAHAAENIVWSYFLEGKYAQAIEAAKNYKPDAVHSSANPLLLRYFSLIRLGRRGEAESLLKEEAAKFQGPATEHVLLLETEGRVSEGLPLDPKSEASRRSSFFSGLRALAAGRPARGELEFAASEHGESVVALAARIELERLGPKAKQ